MAEITLNGIIIKGIGGFYYVEAAGEVYECKARGAFRKKKITPLAGDNVTITVKNTFKGTYVTGNSNTGYFFITLYRLTI